MILDGSDASAEGGSGPPRWRLALERAHALILRASRVLEQAPPSGADLAPAAEPLEGALGFLYEVLDKAGDPLVALRASKTDLGVASAVLDKLAAVDPSFSEAAGWLGDAGRELAIAEERFGRVQPEVAPPAEDLRASKDLPRLHRIDRPRLVPMLRLPPPVAPPPEPLPPLPKPTSPEELDKTIAEVQRRAEERRKAREEREAARARARAERRAAEAPDENDPPPGFARGRFSEKTRDDFVAERARECLDEVAMVGMQRAPLLGDPWRFALVLERRMLAAIDAIAALGGPALARLEPLVIDSPAKDPSRGFAIAMILGCFEGRDALGAIERVLRHLGPADPEVIAAIGGALKLVPHPELPAVLRVMLGDADAAIRAMAIDVLAYRGLATPMELSAAARDAAPSVVAAALPALGLVRAPDLGTALEPARAHDEPAMREAAWTAMMLSGSSFAADVIGGELDGPLGSRAAVPLAIVGDERDAARLLDRMRRAPSPGLVNAVGWAGSVEAVPALLDLLGHDDPVVQLSAAYSLDRITGARLYEDVEVPPETIAVADIEEPDVGEPKAPRLAREISDARDRPSEGASDKLTQPSIDVDRWRAYWVEKSPEVNPALRYRRGSPYSPVISLWELDALPLTPGERRWLQRELVVRTGQMVRFDPHDFVAVQEEALREWGPIAQRMSGNAGQWIRPTRK